MIMPGTTNILDILVTGFRAAGTYWWIWLPFILGLAAYKEYGSYQRAKFIAGLKWTTLEILAPPEILFSSPKAADNFFAGLHATHSGGTGWKSMFFQGKVPPWFSFEIVSNGGEVHFYIRCTEDQRNVIEGLLFAQYPDAEIRVVPDYIDLLPASIDLSQYDVSGAELEFTKEAAYPIKTYEDFEEGGGKDEYARLDPIAPLMEAMGALHPGEFLWLQFLVRATGGDWTKDGQKVVNKMIGKEEKPAEPGLFAQIITFPFWLLNTVLTEFEIVAKVEEKKKEEKPFSLQGLTPAQKEVLEKIEYKLAKLAFKTGIRLLYTASKPSFNGSRIASVTGMFKQLYYNNLNSFKPGNATRDKGRFNWIFPSDKGFGANDKTNQKKVKMYGEYRKRTFPKKDGKEMICILNTQELATLWHMPGLNVKSPMVPRVQAKKGQPPAILPTR